jgi:hypothetical protein
MNPAVAYLVLACGTQRNNRDTSWSVEAVYNHGGISPSRGKAAIQELLGSCLAKQTKTGTRPAYELMGWSEIVAERLKTDQTLIAERAVFHKIAQGKRLASTEVAARDRLINMGLLQITGERVLRPISTEFLEPTAENIWLPKTLVTGTSAGEYSPIARIRRTRDVMTLQLLVDLYQAQHLRDDGGISRKVLRENYERQSAGEQGIYKVWSFESTERTAFYGPITEPHWSGTEKQIWPRFKLLEQEGLITFVPHLCESNDADSEVIHPYGIDWSEGGLQDLENQVGLAAREAGVLMADPQSRQLARYENTFLFAPVPRTYSAVQMVGIARLRYRPHTRITSQRWGRLQAGLPTYIEKYRELRIKAGASVAKETA